MHGISFASSQFFAPNSMAIIVKRSNEEEESKLTYFRFDCVAICGIGFVCENGEKREIFSFVDGAD